MTIVISGIGRVTEDGMGPGENLTPFSSAEGGISELSSKTVFGDLDNHHYKHRYGRMDDYSKLGLAAITFALRDAGLDVWEKKRPFGIIVSTVYGCMSTDFEYYDTVIHQRGLLASPNLFAYTLPNSLLGDAAICFGLTGPNFAINESFHTGLRGLGMAIDCILSGDNKVFLAGLCDLGLPPRLGKAGRLSPFAIFLVLKKGPKGECDFYGEIDLDKKGTVFFNGEAVDDLFGLVRMCLAGPLS